MNFINHYKQTVLPGLLLALLVAAFAKFLALYLPQLGGATLAILFGIFLGNTVFKQSFLQTGTKFAESRLLEIAVVLLGMTVTFQTIAKMGVEGVAYVFLMMTGTIVFTYQIGKKIGFNQKMALLMAGGNAVCGSSAIASIAPSIHAKEEEKGQIITLVNLLGTFMMLTLPFLGQAIFGDNIIAKSALLGGTLQSVGQVVAGASLLNEEVVQYAMLFKIMRILCLAVVVYIFTKITAPKQTTSNPVNLKKKFPLPWYLIGFLVFCLLNSFLPIPTWVSTNVKFISNWFETTALAAIGLRLDLRRFLQEGPRFILYGVSVGLFQTVAAIVFIFLLF